MPRPAPPHPSREPAPARRRKPTSSRPARSQVPVAVIGLTIGAVLLVAALLSAYFARSGSRDALDSQGLPAGPVAFVTGGDSGSSATAQTESPAERKKRFADALEHAKRIMGANRCAIVTIQNAPTPALDAEYYFRSRLHDARLDVERIKQNKRTSRSTRVSLEIEFPEPNLSFGGHFSGTTHTYYVGPIDDLRAFADQLTFGDVVSVDPKSLNILVRAQLPSPCPDPYEELNTVVWGPGNMIRIELTGAPLAALKGAQVLIADWTIGGHKIGNTRYTESPDRQALRGYLGTNAPVETLASLVDFGRVTLADPATRRIAVQVNPARLPAPPVAPWEDPERPGQRNDKPRPGESDIDWVLRILRIKDGWYHKEALKVLANAPVEPARVREVTEALAEFGITENGQSAAWEVLDAGDKWRGPALTALAAKRLTASFWDTKRLMAWIVEFPTVEGAEAVGRLLKNPHHGELADRTLAQIGAVAEPALLKLLNDREDLGRERICELLAKIGGEESVKALEEASRTESRKSIIKLQRQVINAIQARLGTGTANDADRDPAETVP